MPRKNPYSGKQKKQQLKEKKARKQDGPKYLADWSDDDSDDNKATTASGDKEESTENVKGRFPLKNVEETDVQKLNSQPEKNSKASINNFRLHFLKEPDKVIDKRKKQARKPIKRLHEDGLEYSITDAYPSHFNLNFPKRPSWSYNLSKDQLDRQEKEYFQNYLSEMVTQPNAEDLSYFELNLENWRQLWRVIEISDILLIIADIRYPVLHISPSLLDYIQHTLGKPVIFILNKIDFVSPVMTVAWKRYLQQQFPGVYVVFFSSFIKHQQGGSDDNGDGDGLPMDFDPSKVMFRKASKGSTSTLGPTQLYKAVADIVKDGVDLSTWRQHLEEEGLFYSAGGPDEGELCSTCTGEQRQHMPSNMGCSGHDGDDVDDHEDDGGGEDDDDHEDGDGKDNDKQMSKMIGGLKQQYKDGVVTIGCIGYPNVGKSSVLNSLKGKKVVSVSQTPGHTKHLQTIYLTPTVKLCDCPGLVFPSVVPRALQVIAGIFPVAQVREPYSVVKYLAERVDMPALLRIKPPPDSDNGGGAVGYAWSAYDICEAWAVKCGFITPKAARPDIYRAANSILRLAVSGRIRLCFRPPEYSQHLDDVRSDPNTPTLHRCLQARMTQQAARGDDEDDDEDSEEDEDEEEDDSRDNLVH